jgi:hypothetical protein
MMGTRFPVELWHKKKVFVEVVSLGIWTWVHGYMSRSVLFL